MVDQLLLALTLVAALGCGLMAGRLLRLLGIRHAGAGPPRTAAGIAAMQSINIAVINPLFLAAFSARP